MKKYIAFPAAAALLVAAALTTSGCSGCGYDENKPVATIDGKTAVTVGDFVYHYKRAVEMAPPQDKPVINTFDDAKDFLDDIITSRVLELEAEALGYGDDENLKRDLDTYRSNLLREWARKKIEDQVKVTEAEILDYFNKNKEWRRVSFIMCDKKGQAEKAYAELEAGKPWEEVVRTYTIFEENKEQGGKAPEEFYYTGDNVSRAVYETEVGAYTPVVESETGDMWLIFRVDEKIPGQKDEYAQVKDNIRGSIKQYKVDLKMHEHAEKLREEAKIERNPELYDAVITGDVAGAGEKYSRKGEIISTVGDVPVYFDSWYEGMFVQLSMSPEMVEEYRDEEPEGYKEVMDGRLKALEGEALLEWDAIRSGADKELDFIRDINRFRAGKLVDRIYEEVFVPKIPEVTEGEIKEYFESHKHEFQEPEMAAIHVVAFPAKADAEAVHAGVKAGGDIVALSGERIEQYFQELDARGEMPEEQPAPEDMPVSTFLEIPKEAAEVPAGPSGPEGGENPIMAELRPRVFKLSEGALSELFQLKDGRWAFFKYEEHFPFVQHTLEEELAYDQAKASAGNEKMASPEVDRKCQAWFEELRNKHTIEIDEGALKMAFKKVQKL
ncbi:MAG: peptidyl-prolyl cis-trans isomerase [Candidatus Coatesbacteria bacterium]|nr:MAG: peptidyl-prolyl cis-trans isomerase [Candidatus Coatesbacteria bacterium]